MENLKMHTPDLADENFKKLVTLFPNAVTETITGYKANGEPIIERAIDADVLRQEISATVVEGPQERYQFTWPDKKKSVVLANQPIAKTLRLDREKSVGKDGTPVENYSKSRPARFIKDSVGFRYRNLDGTYSRKTWQCIKGSWYYFYSSGYMARRTKLGMYYVGTNGKMVTNRWIKIGNYKYYYGADGRMTKKVRIKSSSTGSSGNTIVDIN